MKKLFLACICVCLTSALYSEESLKFEISFPKEISDQAQDGRLLLMLSTDNSEEPRMQINDSLKTQQVFGTDVEGLQPGQVQMIDSSAFGYPIQNLKNFPAGEYFVQALLNRYETFRLKTGQMVKLPPEMGEGQVWNEKPGNFYSKPVKLRIDPLSSETIKITMDQKIAPKEEPKDTKYVRHIKLQS